MRISTEVSWRRVGKILFYIFAIGLLAEAVVVLASYQLGPWMRAQWMSDIHPSINATPVPLEDMTQSSLPDKPFVHLGVTFRLPWTDAVAIRPVDDQFMLTSKQSGFLTLSDSRGRFDSVQIMRAFALSDPDPHLGLNPPNYDILAKALSTKATDIKWWKTPTQNATPLIWLGMKSLSLRCSGPLYMIAFGTMRGFEQIGSTSQLSCVRLDLFDQYDRHYQLEVMGKDSNPAMTQPQINALVASFQSTSKEK